MAHFNFRLETLLRIRTAARDERRSQLSEAYKAEQVLLQQEAQIIEEKQQTKQRAEQISQPGTVDVDLLLNVHRYELLLEAQHQKLRQQKQQVDEEIERRRQVLVEADREVRILEKLREKKLLAHQQNEHLLEIKQFDEEPGEPEFEWGLCEVEAR